MYKLSLVDRIWTEIGRDVNYEFEGLYIHILKFCPRALLLVVKTQPGLTTKTYLKVWGGVKLHLNQSYLTPELAGVCRRYLLLVCDKQRKHCLGFGVELNLIPANQIFLWLSVRVDMLNEWVAVLNVFFSLMHLFHLFSYEYSFCNLTNIYTLYTVNQMY